MEREFWSQNYRSEINLYHQNNECRPHQGQSSTEPSLHSALIQTAKEISEGKEVQARILIGGVFVANLKSPLYKPPLKTAGCHS